MWGLSLRLAFKGSKESAVRFIATALAVAVGVSLLLSVLAEFHAFQVAGQRPCWECTTKTGQDRDANSQLLWLYRTDAYKGKGIQRLDIAALGPQAPLLPGIARLPHAGEFYVSPALGKLLQTVPYSELGARFPGKKVGVIGNAALPNPNALVIFIGRSSSEVSQTPQAFRVTKITATPKKQSSTSFMRFAFAIGAAGILFPIVMLTSTATRLAAARREERYAAFRLVGATPRQVTRIASVDAILSATLGTLLGVLLFVSLQPVLAKTALMGDPFFAHTVTPTLLGFIGVLIGVPLAAGTAAIFSLRKVKISPLGVSRKVTPRAPKLWRLFPFFAGIALFISPIIFSKSDDPTTPLAIPGFILMMAGLIIAGPLVAAAVASVLSKQARHAPGLLAARRLADNPYAAFRAVSGLVLAIFVGSVVAGMMPAVLASQKATTTDAMTNVLAVPFFTTPGPDCGSSCEVFSETNEGLDPAAGAALIQHLESYDGVKVYPVFTVPDIQVEDPVPTGPRKAGMEEGVSHKSLYPVMQCSSLAALQLLGHCSSNRTITNVSIDGVVLNHTIQNIVQPNDAATPTNVHNLKIRTLFVYVENVANLEKVRTYLAIHAVSPSSEVPRTFGEIRKDAVAASVAVQRIVFAAILLTLIIAGCSLAVAVGGGLIERKRPFTLLRLSGVPLRALYKVTLLESMLPLVSATVLAAGSGFGLAMIIVASFAPAGTPLPTPTLEYAIIMVSGVCLSALVVCATLPLVGQITKPDEARFE